MAAKTKTPAASKPVVRARNIPEPVRLLLAVRAGGRCEFDGCSRYLFEHHLTLKEGNFSQAAHIVAFSERGPRGADGKRPKDVHDAENLMLLCPGCHKLIDDNPGDYSRATLEGFKKAHEERIYRLTGLSPDRHTTVLLVTTRIADEMSSVTRGQVFEAINPNYADDREFRTVDLTGLRSGEAEALGGACSTIENEVERLYAPRLNGERLQRVSVFALAPIPVLVFLGSRLSDKVPTDLFQRHRDTEDWMWKTDGEPVEYSVTTRRRGSKPENVALVLSLSGVVDDATIPAHIDDTFTIYEISLVGQHPDLGFLRQRRDLDSFCATYRTFLRRLPAEHGRLDELHVFPAVPAPIAVALGREPLPKIDPSLVVYDNDRAAGMFVERLTVSPALASGRGAA